MLKPDVFNDVSLLKKSNPLRGEISFEKNSPMIGTIKRHLEGRMKLISFYKGEGQMPSEDFSEEDRTQEIENLQDESFGKQREIAAEWMIALQARLETGAQDSGHSLQDAWYRPVTEGIADAIEHGSDDGPITMNWIFDEKNIAVIIKNTVAPQSLETVRIFLERLQAHTKILTLLHKEIDTVTEPQKTELIENLKFKSDDAFRTVIPGLEQKGILHSFMLRGNGTYLLAINRINYAWLRLDDGIIRRCILLDQFRVAHPA